MKIRLLVIIGLLLFAGLVQFLIDTRPEKKETRQTTPPETLSSAEYLGAYLGTIVLGGAKPLIVDYLWLKADKLKQHKQYEEVVSLLKLIAHLQPKFVEVWSFNGWVMAYDISKGQDTPEAKWNWVREGIDYLRNGLQWNPDDPKLLQDIAFIYYHRIPQERYLMTRLEEIAKKDTYEISKEWYQRSIVALKSRNIPAYQIEPAEVMSAACWFLHIFELVRKKHFSKAISELNQLVDYYRRYIEKNKTDKYLWARRIQGYQSVLPVLRLEAELTPVDPQFFAKLSDVLTRYKSIIDTQFIDDKLIAHWLENYFVRYFSSVFSALEQGDFNQVEHWLAELEKLCDLITPVDMEITNKQYFYFFTYHLRERINRLKEILELEKTCGAGLIDRYQKYLSDYGEFFDCSAERRRLRKLQEE